MFYSYNDISKLLKIKSTEECYHLWKTHLNDTISYFYNKLEANKDLNYKNPSKIKTRKTLVRNIINTLNLFTFPNKVSVDISNDQCVLKDISKIIAYECFASKVKIHKHHLIALFDFIKWDCDLILQSVYMWEPNEQYIEWDIIELLELAEKYSRTITGYHKSNVIHGLLMAIYCCGENRQIENFIINNQIKLTDPLKNNNNPMISDMVKYFNKKGYQLIK